MNWTLFLLIMSIGEMLVLLQALLASLDGYYSEPQMSREWKRGYSFLQHGGVWADALIITPLIAYLIGEYQFEYFSTSGLYILWAAIFTWVALGMFLFAPAGRTVPEAHAHDGIVTLAGWAHTIYSVLASWIIVMAYTSAVISKWDIVIMSILLILWVIIGIRKFDPMWKFDIVSTSICVSETIGIIALAIWRLS